MEDNPMYAVGTSYSAHENALQELLVSIAEYLPHLRATDVNGVQTAMAALQRQTELKLAKLAEVDPEKLPQAATEAGELTIGRWIELRQACYVLIPIAKLIRFNFAMQLTPADENEEAA
jgi:hypothetical protein